MADLYQTAQQFRAEIIRMENQAVGRVLSAYVQAWERVAADLQKLLEKAEAAKAKDGSVPLSWLHEQGRLQALLDQMTEEITTLAAHAAAVTDSRQRKVVDLVQQRSQKLIQAAPKPPGIQIEFQRLPREQLEKFVGLTGDGSPLTASFQRLADDLGAQVAQTITQKITEGLVRGDGPAQIFRDLTQAIESKGGNPYKDPQIVRRLGLAVRSSLHWSYSESTRETYKENGVKRWRWLTAPTGACPACHALDGQIFEVDEPQGNHPNCRCCIVPVLDDEEQPKDTDAEFAKLPPERQREILGDAAYAAYTDGKITLSDMVGERTNRYGTQRGTRSLLDLLGTQLAQAYYRKAARLP